MNFYSQFSQQNFFENTKKRLIIESKYFLTTEEKARISNNSLNSLVEVIRENSVAEDNNKPVNIYLSEKNDNDLCVTRRNNMNLNLLKIEKIPHNQIEKSFNLNYSNICWKFVGLVSFLSFLYDYNKIQRRSCFTFSLLIPTYSYNILFRLMVLNGVFYLVFTDYHQFYTNIYTKYILNRTI